MSKTQRLLLAIALLLLAGPVPAEETKQEQVHAHSHHVMPFAMEKTLHVFTMTEQGGVQRVLVRDTADSEQQRLIREHLTKEAEAFGRGDYSDPTHLHGAGMPGLKDVQAGAAKIRVSYRDLPGGGEIRFETTDLHLLTAIHRWFGAQLSEHGADATSE
jgi:hypothetical protein